MTEMYTRCWRPARCAARTRFRVASSSPLLLPAQCTMIAGTFHRGLDVLVLEQVTGDVLDALRGLVGASAEHPHVAACGLQPRNDVPPERAGAACDQDG